LERDQITIEIREVTELGLTTAASSQAAIIHDLSAAGFRVQLDHFGVGFAGLSNLAKLDINGIKIDAGLASNFSADDINEKIVRKIVELCNDFDLTVVAEGSKICKPRKNYGRWGAKRLRGIGLELRWPQTISTHGLTCGMSTRTLCMPETIAPQSPPAYSHLDTCYSRGSNAWQPINMSTSWTAFPRPIRVERKSLKTSV
jgi:hypothetical protein